MYLGLAVNPFRGEPSNLAVAHSEPSHKPAVITHERRSRASRQGKGKPPPLSSGGLSVPLVVYVGVADRAGGEVVSLALVCRLTALVAPEPQVIGFTALRLWFGVRSH